MFANLSKEQAEEIERMIKSAYIEGWCDGAETGEDYTSDAYNYSLAKNQSCVIIAERFQENCDG